MKNALLLVSILFTATLTAQISKLTNPKLSPFQKTEIKIGIVDVSLEYSRPSMRGRKIFGALEPYDKVWRTGANKNTKIVFSDYVIIGDVEVAPGTYTIFTKPSVDTWDVYFHAEIDEYGVPDTFNPKNSIVQLNVPVIKLDKEIETLGITFDNLTANAAILNISWEKIKIAVPIKIPTDKILKNYLSKKNTSLSREYSLAAYIYFDKEKDSKKALATIKKSIEIEEKGMSFELWLKNANLEDQRLAYNYYLKSQILYDLDEKEEAIKSARQSLIIAEKIKSEYYINTNTENIKAWGKQ
ncbi:DUF2911 domain-containing protein [Aquimarina sp. MMG015]|uniref:DUF2911 domain-containing protein n=1 Tax=Aquimarina sp. MMG015 TaxID=2822689 RepID=UPI001B3A3904|nr:DUF2911 domain-containing protein [Aquimarina sp. MMG015]MBQ4804679.1 DUF2911 domain-containing protein [Aquimarina sp. MMG015]